MGHGNQTIVLSMIVKQEANVIRRCLESVKPFIDAWAILDTGSTDGTQDIIRDVLKGIPGELGSAVQPPRKWWQRKQRFDFAKHRNIALGMARDFGCEYILLIDADEEIRLAEGATGEFPNLDQGRYVANFRQLPEGNVWHRTLLVRADEPWYYKWPIHETLHNDADPEGKAAILGGLEVLSYSDGGRNQDKRAKYLSDAKACLEAAKREPNEPRHWYYVGQSYAGAHEYQKALKAYQKRIAMDGWDEERWYAIRQSAQLKQLLGYNWRDVVAGHLRAFNERPWRAEPLHAAGVLCRDNGEPALGAIYLRHACHIPYPQDSFLIDTSVYAWKAADDLCGCLAQLNQLDECVQILSKLSECDAVPEDDRQRILENIELCHSEMAKAA